MKSPTGWVPKKLRRASSGMRCKVPTPLFLLNLLPRLMISPTHEACACVCVCPPGTQRIPCLALFWVCFTDAQVGALDERFREMPHLHMLSLQEGYCLPMAGVPRNVRRSRCPNFVVCEAGLLGRCCIARTSFCAASSGMSSQSSSSSQSVLVHPVKLELLHVPPTSNAA